MEDRITGELGHAEVLIPRSKLDESCEYKKDENVFIVKGDSNLRIDKGSRIRCKCFEIQIEMSIFCGYDRFSDEDCSGIAESFVTFHHVRMILLLIALIGGMLIIFYKHYSNNSDG
jgi:hypothetical protein